MYYSYHSAMYYFIWSQFPLLVALEQVWNPVLVSTCDTYYKDKNIRECLLLSFELCILNLDAEISDTSRNVPLLWYEWRLTTKISPYLIYILHLGATACVTSRNLPKSPAATRLLPRSPCWLIALWVLLRRQSASGVFGVCLETIVKPGTNPSRGPRRLPGNCAITVDKGGGKTKLGESCIRVAKGSTADVKRD